jgi:hypothetical protein
VESKLTGTESRQIIGFLAALASVEPDLRPTSP